MKIVKAFDKYSPFRERAPVTFLQEWVCLFYAFSSGVPEISLNFYQFKALQLAVQK